MIRFRRDIIFSLYLYLEVVFLLGGCENTFIFPSEKDRRV
jgi:hypothetical protein